MDLEAVEVEIPNPNPFFEGFVGPNPLPEIIAYTPNP